MRIIAVVNQKGGVGKTTTSVNLGAALALRGRRVLLVDMDPQGNLTDHLLGDPPEGTERPSVYDVLVEGRDLAECVVATSTPGLSVVPSHQDLAGAELDLAAVIGREVILRDALAEVPSDAYDYVFLDCPPSLGLLSLNALAAAHEVFIALQTEFFAMRGLGALDRTIELVRRRINPRLHVGGIVPTLVDPTRLSREVLDEVRGHYGDRLFAARVRSNIRLAEAPSHGKHIFDYAPESQGAADYAALAKELEEGRPEVPAETPGTLAPPAEVAAGGAGPSEEAARRAPPPRRGVARAIAEAVAALAGPPAPAVPVASAPGAAAPVAAPQVTPAVASAAPPTSAVAAPASPPAAGSPPAPAVAAAAVPIAPPALPRRPAVPLPVLRPGPRPLSLAPMPTRAPSALPRPKATAGGGRAP